MDNNAAIITWTAVLAGATVFLALATIWLALEARKARLESSRKDKEVAFRAALTEMAHNIVAIETYNPRLGIRTHPANWIEQRLQFENLKYLLATTWLYPKLWERIQTIIVNLETREIHMKATVEGGTSSATDEYYLLDLYLKQVARYLAAEMLRQKFESTELNQVAHSELYKPLPWVYGTRDQTSEGNAQLLETQVTPPFLKPSTEPTDKIFAGCRLATLIEEARLAHEKMTNELSNQLGQRS